MKKVLVVEDEPVVRELLCDLLSVGYDCRAARTADEGLRLLAGEHFDAAITDVKLPGRGGRDFLREARELRPGLPVIVISGGHGGGREQVVEAGAFGYLLKPFTFAEVEGLVARAVGGEEGLHQ